MSWGWAVPCLKFALKIPPAVIPFIAEYCDDDDDDYYYYYN
jgi:hypothetical protein